MDEETRHASIKLYDVMNHVGVNEEMRKLHRDYSISHEIAETAIDHMLDRESSLYRFGSSCEGTTTPGMGSDVDVVLCNESFPVVQDIRRAPLGRSFLMVHDRHTKPGYVKLQEVLDGTPLFRYNCNIRDHSVHMFDNMGRVCLKYVTFPGRYGDIIERSGPADTFTNTPGCLPMDTVYALRSRTCPPAAIESLRVCTRNGWLTLDDVDKMEDFGCLFVGVGHPTSDEKDIEWRISFSLQERQLMFKINPSQYVCYVLLKLIKNMITSEPGVGKSITSYHMKTCLFRMITKSKPDRWTPEYLIDCTFTCLHELLQCLYNENLPNFFIKKNNMFECRVYGLVRERLISRLQEILQEGYRVFFRIQSDGIGELFAGNVDPCITITWERGGMMKDVYKNTCLSLVYQQQTVCEHLSKLSLKDAKLVLSQQLFYLASLVTINEHSEEETKAAVQTLEPILHQLYAQYLASLAFTTDKHETRQSLLQDSNRHLRRGITWNLMSGRLVQATILYRQGNIEMCQDILEQLKQSLCEEVQSVCGCCNYQSHSIWTLVEHVLSGHTDPQSFRESYIAVCSKFLPAHIEMVPTALKFEFHRLSGTRFKSSDDCVEDWYYWAVVDSKVYLYFMQYLVYSHLKRHRDKQIAIENLLMVLQQDPNLGHRETGYNLLGWIYCQEGDIQTAACCFLQSWRIRPHHNAATWHMLILISQQCLRKLVVTHGRVSLSTGKIFKVIEDRTQERVFRCKVCVAEKKH